ncbi:MAG: rhomboid family intramembrane serine protease [Paracoccaceae bacterium]
MQELRAARVSYTLALLCIAAYLRGGPGHVSLDPVPLFRSYVNVFQHGNLAHLLINCAMVIAGGRLTERAIGPWHTALLVLACAVLGSTAQYYMVDHRFIGMSGPAYGLIAFAAFQGAKPRDWAVLWLFALGALALEVQFRSQSIAIYAHIISTFIGGGAAMFGSLFGPKTPTLKPMQRTHISKAIEIINETDEDDAAEAEEEFLENGVAGMFVLLEGSDVLGITGYSFDDQVADVAWLSWTYLRQDCAGKGLGGQMLNDLLGMLKDQGIRKIFIATSDYAEFGKPIYAAAHKMYEEFGAAVEMEIPNYHAPGETKIVFGLDNPEYVAGTPAPLGEKTGMAIIGSGAEPETDNVVGLNWEEAPVGLIGIDFALEKVTENGARMVVLAIPSDLSAANAQALEAHKFKRCGALKDYYSLGLHQDWWMCSLESD